MQYRTLGKTGLEVSVVGVGCWQMGGAPWTGTSDEESIATIHHAEDLGVNLLDTAPTYGGGHSEEVIGKALVGRRDRFVVATKVKPIDDDLDEQRAWGQVTEVCESSLKRLQTDYIDLLQLHLTPPEEIMPAVVENLASLKKAGKIRWFGISSNNSRVVRKLLSLGELAVLQVGYNMINRGGESTLALAAEENLGALIRVPLASGALSGKYFGVVPQVDAGDLRESRLTSAKSIEALKRLEDLRFLTEGGKRTMTQAALRFVIDTHGATSVIPGAKSRKQLEENAGAADVPPLTNDERARAAAIAGEVGSFSGLGVIQS